MSERVLATRLANALFANAAMSSVAGESVDGITELLGIGRVTPAVDLVLEAYAAAYGGLWVGGKATLTPERLVFEPNAMNRLAHENGGALRLDLPLAELERVTSRFGWVTGIIDVGAHGRRFSLRCFGSNTFTQAIAAAARARSPR